MAELQNLKRFQIEKAGEGFRLHIEDEAGETFGVLATHDQMDVITEQLDEVLDADEEAEAVDDDSVAEKD